LYGRFAVQKVSLIGKLRLQFLVVISKYLCYF